VGRWDVSRGRGARADGQKTQVTDDTGAAGQNADQQPPDGDPPPPDAPPAPGGAGDETTPPENVGFVRRGTLEHGEKASRYGYRHDDRETALRCMATPVKLVGELPVSDLTPLVLSVLDQGAAPFCFAGAVAQALRMCDVKNGQPNPVLPSRLELVYFAHAIEGDPTAFDGAFISDVFQAIEQLGFAPESMWPYSDSQDGNYKVRPSEDVVRMSFDNITLSYKRILTDGDQRLADVAAALAANQPVVFGTDVTNAFASNQLGEDFVVDVPDEADIDGGHAMVLVGRRVNGDFRCLNDWSKDWGDGGYCWLTPEMVKWANTRELWAVNFSRATARFR